MIRKLCLSVAIVVVLTPVLLAQTVDEIIAKNVAARGGMDKLKAVQSVKVTGKMSLPQGMEAPLVMILKRPEQLRMEFTIQGLTAVQAYDGKNGWSIMPFTGKKDAEAMTADELKETQEQADIDGPLVDYKAKGSQVEFLGKDKVEGTDAYKLKLTRKNGDVDTIYLDADSFLEIKEEGKRSVRGTDREFESSTGDYREVNGLMLPFAIEAGQKGSADKQKITIEKYEFNVPVDDASFKMPPPAPAAKPEATKPEEKKEPPKN